MRTIIVMFDTLTRSFLPNYGNDWVYAPNFARLSSHCATMDQCYVSSMPCMPARRDLHTGKYNFLHRGWGPLEPFDNSVMEILRAHGIYTHLCTDHSHYWEDGGATYHNRYDTWEGFRGQEGDHYVANDIRPDNMPENGQPLNKWGHPSVQQHYCNRTRQQDQSAMSETLTFNAGLEFLQNHAEKDNWLVQIESFDPHEPFYVPKKFRQIYGLPEEETTFWPRYGTVDTDTYKNEIMNSRKEYAALLSMCDENLGRVLDFMDSHDMWKDTTLIVNTDHGFLLGEHEWLGKNFPPIYDELAHIPFFIHVPQIAESGRRIQLCSTVDIAPTILDLYGIKTDELGETDGISMMPILKNDSFIRNHVLFGMHGGYTCWSDGRYVYMKASATKENQPLSSYTLMPTNIRGFFTREQLLKPELANPGRYSNHIPCLKYAEKIDYLRSYDLGDRVYDLLNDPKEEHNLFSEIDVKPFNEKLNEALLEAEAPDDEFIRLGINH